MSGLILGDYTLTGCIGRGGMGEVWAATHALHRVPVAVKLLTLASAREPRFQEAFRNEVRAVAVLDHPAIVEIYDYGTVGAVAARMACNASAIRRSPAPAAVGNGSSPVAITAARSSARPGSTTASNMRTKSPTRSSSEIGISAPERTARACARRRRAAR